MEKTPEFIKSIPFNFSKEQKALIIKAYKYAKDAHTGQKRKSGEDYIEHPVNSAIILGQIFPDTETIVATLLHDVTEDTDKTKDEITEIFGNEIAELVDGVSKLGHVRLLNSKDKYYVENLRKMFIATSEDIRVMVIKLADRIHNMRTIEALPAEKQMKIATETLSMYAPIAGRLGIGSWKDELQELSFKIVNSAEYERVNNLLQTELDKRHQGIKDMTKQLSSFLKQEGVKFIEIKGRTKGVYTLYKKLKRYDNDISKIYDIMALRIVSKSTADCYSALGIIHHYFNQVPGRIKDFIATPKPNGYQSIHTTVFDKNGYVFEVQLRTDLMDEIAERGVAAHWFYEEHGKADVLQKQTTWFKELHAWQEETMNQPDEFLESLKIDFFKDRIFVLTPKGDVKDLPSGASVIDFAFAVHTDLGEHMFGAKINGKMAKIYDELSQGDVVEIIKSKKPAVMSRDWLDSAKTSSARSKIRSYLRENDSGLFQRIRELKLKDVGLPKFFRKK